MSQTITFKRTGCKQVDAILEAVEAAASGYHSTEQWNDRDMPGDTTAVEDIQKVAQQAADEIRFIVPASHLPDEQAAHEASVLPQNQ